MGSDSNNTPVHLLSQPSNPHSVLNANLLQLSLLSCEAQEMRPTAWQDAYVYIWLRLMCKLRASGTEQPAASQGLRGGHICSLTLSNTKPTDILSKDLDTLGPPSVSHWRRKGSLVKRAHSCVGSCGNMWTILLVEDR